MRHYIVIGILLFALIGAAAVSAWEDCPFGEVNDPWPGECGRYWDSDNNGICDLSEPAPEDRNSAVIEPEPEPVDQIIPDDEQASQADETEDTNTASPTRSVTYHVLEIGVVLSALYFSPTWPQRKVSSPRQIISGSGTGCSWEHSWYQAFLDLFWHLL